MSPTRIKQEPDSDASPPRKADKSDSDASPPRRLPNVKQVTTSKKNIWIKNRPTHGHLHTGQLCCHFVFRQVDIMGGNTWDLNYAPGLDFLDHILVLLSEFV